VDCGCDGVGDLVPGIRILYGLDYGPRDGLPAVIAGVRDIPGTY